jgi:UDP-N-acetylmuramoyl-L-alanyl-D-glutamate--2,6-diaminopimelate ligase
VTRSIPNAAAQRLSQLLDGIAPVDHAPGPVITALALDSRAATPGCLFIAVPGGRLDGRAFIDDAVRRGAAAVVYEAGGAPVVPGVPAVAVAGLAGKVGEIAHRFYGAASHRLDVIGVTGTNGKTTCTHLLADSLSDEAHRCALIGTLGAGFPGAVTSTRHTTPDAVNVHRLLAEFSAAGADYVCMEVSSHALEQGRAIGIRFHTAVFTNLSQDHLDYHGDMDAYGAAKARLFAWPGLRNAVVNADDAFGQALLLREPGAARRVGYGIARGDVRAVSVEPDRHGLRLRVTAPQGEAAFHSALMGRFNASNLLAVLATLIVLGFGPAEAAQRLQRARPVPGRMERFTGHEGLPPVVVDYAHTPDALEKALAAAREHASGKLVCVFGCGGDRDRGKRPLMGATAERLADVVIVTDDNPRHESPQSIVADILAGMRSRPTVIHDRVAAIRHAVGLARGPDVVLVAGKGHETTQQVGDAYLPLSDRETVSAILREAA